MWTLDFVFEVTSSDTYDMLNLDFIFEVTFFGAWFIFGEGILEATTKTKSGQ
jgi:hypothetical protein